MTVALLGNWETGLSKDTLAGSNRLLLFGVGLKLSSSTTSPTANTITYGGQSMARVTVPSATTPGWVTSEPDTSVGRWVNTEVWYLNDSDIQASTSTAFAVDWVDDPGDPNSALYSHVFLQDVSQGSPFGSAATNSTNTDTPNPITTAALSNTNGDMVITVVSCDNNMTYTANNGFTEGTDQNTGGFTSSAAYKAATGAAETPSMTGSGAPRSQAIIGFVVQEQVASSLTDVFTFVDSLDYWQSFTLTIGDTDLNPIIENLDRGIDFGEPPGNITAQRISQEEFGQFFLENLIVTGFHLATLSDSFTFTEKIIAPIIDVDLVEDIFTFADSVGINITEGDGWVRVGTPVGTWSAVAAPLPSSEFRTLGTFTDVSGGIDFIPVLASGAKGGPYFTISTDRPIKLRSKSNITSTPGLQP